MNPEATAFAWGLAGAATFNVVSAALVFLWFVLTDDEGDL